MNSRYVYKLDLIFKVILHVVWFSSIVTLYVVSYVTVSLHLTTQSYIAGALCAFDAVAFAVYMIGYLVL